MRTLVLPAIAGCVVCFISVSLAQSQGDSGGDDSSTASTVVVNPPPPATALQKLEVSKDRVILKGYTEVGRISGERSSMVRVLAVQITDANHQALERGLVLIVTAARSNDISATSYVDYVELDPLIDALDALQKADKNTTQLAEFEARYRTHGDLELANLNVDGSRMIAVKSNQIAVPSGRYTAATAYFRAARLTEIRQQIMAAKQTLDAIKP